MQYGIILFVVKTIKVVLVCVGWSGMHEMDAADRSHWNRKVRVI